MALPGSLQLSHGLGLCRNLNSNKDRRGKGRCKMQLFNAYPVSFMKQDYRGLQHLHHINRSTHRLSRKSRSFKCHCFLVPGERIALPSVKVATTVLTRCCNVLQNRPVIVKLIPAVGIIIFAVWGVGPLMFQTRKLFFQKSDNSWKKSTTHYIVTSYLRPLLLWTGAVLICRAFEPVILPTEASQAVKERLLNFVKSLSTVVAFAYCLSSVIQQAQKIVTENVDASETRNMGFQFAGKAVYSAVWIAAFSLFMELLGFSTQKWVTAGGFGQKRSNAPNSSTEKKAIPNNEVAKGKEEDKKTENAVSASEKPAAASNGVVKDPLGDARNKVQDEIIKEFAAIMATGTMRASEAAALATRRVMERHGQMSVSQS